MLEPTEEDIDFRMDASMSTEDIEPICVGYSLRGEVVGYTSDACVAKRAMNQVSLAQRYWIKRGTGNDAGHFINEQSPNYQKEYLNKVNPHSGRAAYEFRPVGPGCFEQYLNFLKTKNELFLRHAERMIDE